MNIDNNSIDLFLFFNEIDIYLTASILAKYKWSLEDFPAILKKNGKPFFKDYNYYLSISYSSNYTILILSECCIGVDIEIIDKFFEQKIINRFFSNSERFFLSKYYNIKDYNTKCYEIWTKKEAYVKFTGQGIDKYFKFIDTCRLSDKYCFYTISFNNLVISICTDRFFSYKNKKIIFYY